ncbi:MAG: hypothetical protein WC736_14670 [Gallionella sp.]|jgi:hypothetical protein
MSNNVSLLADLRAGKNCAQEAAVAIAQLEQEVEALQSLYEHAVEQRGIAQLENTELHKKLKQTVPDGWQLVPIEPTIRMIGVAGVHRESDEYTGVKSTYRAMLSAAPQHEGLTPNETNQRNS